MRKKKTVTKKKRMPVQKRILWEPYEVGGIDLKAVPPSEVARILNDLFDRYSRYSHPDNKWILTSKEIPALEIAVKLTAGSNMDRIDDLISFIEKYGSVKVWLEK